MQEKVIIPATDGKLIYGVLNGNRAEHKKMHWKNCLNAYICDSRMQVVFSKDLIETWRDLTVEKQINSFQVPAKIIFAGNYSKYDQWKEYLDSIKTEFEYIVISGASHTFSEEGMKEKLWEETLKWLF